MHPVTKAKVLLHRFENSTKSKVALGLLGLGSVGGYVYVLFSKAKKKMDEAAASTKASAERQTGPDVH